MRHLAVAAAAAAALAGLPAAAQIVRVESGSDVAATADAFVAAVEGAGARVFARIDHGAGAESVGSDVGASQLIVFGNPALGTPAIEMNRLAGLVLPLKVLVYEDGEGTVWLAYEQPADMFDGLGIPADAEVVRKMTGALGNLAAQASGG